MSSYTLLIPSKDFTKAQSLDYCRITKSGGQCKLCWKCQGTVSNTDIFVGHLITPLSKQLPNISPLSAYLDINSRRYLWPYTIL